jgi:ATP-dependent Clp protease protease subunit
MPKSDKDPTISNQPYPKVKDRIDNSILEARRIFLSDAVDDQSSQEIIRQLWYLELTDPGKPILFVINSPGGSVDAGFAIWDQVKMISSPVSTLITGIAASMGSILSLCASPKRRFATPHSRIMIHQPRIMGAIQGQATDLEIQAKEMIKTRTTLINIYVQATGKDAATVEKAIDRDTWMTPEEALKFGLLDGIIKNFKELPA